MSSTDLREVCVCVFRCDHTPDHWQRTTCSNVFESGIRFCPILEIFGHLGSVRFWRGLPITATESGPKYREDWHGRRLTKKFSFWNQSTVQCSYCAILPRCSGLFEISLCKLSSSLYLHSVRLRDSTVKSFRTAPVVSQYWATLVWLVICCQAVRNLECTNDKKKKHESRRV